MRNIELIIKAARRQTDNEEYDDSTGLSQDQLIQFANDAQDDLIEGIQSTWPQSFLLVKNIDIVVNQEAYDLPSDTFMMSRVAHVEYSKSGNERDFYPLKQGTISERLSGYSAEPSFYIRLNNQVLLQPKPQSIGAILRVTYQKALPRLDYRLGKIGSVTTVGSAITALTLDTSVPIYSDQLLEEEYFTVVDANGLVTMRSIPISAVDETSGVISLGAFSFVSGETISTGSYVVRGKYSTTHSYLTDNCERYLSEYIAYKIYRRDSSNDSPGQKDELDTTKATVIQSFSVPEHDILTIPVLDGNYLTEDDWS